MTTATGTETAPAGLGQWRLVSWTLRAVTIVALAVDAYVHVDLVDRYAPNQGASDLSQGDLFRAEAVVAVLAALALLVIARWWTWLGAWLVAASAAGGMLLYRYHDPGFLGPLPDMYEPFWFTEKVLAGTAEGVAVATSTMGLLLRGWFHRLDSRRPH
jgi:hypothetical protein